MDLICREENSLIAKYDYDSFCGLRETNTLTAVRFYNRVIRQLSYKAIAKHKSDQYFSDRLSDNFHDMGFTDKDLLIDLQVGNKKEITNMYLANKVTVVK